jgi:hypothetical protein
MKKYMLWVIVWCMWFIQLACAGDIDLQRFNQTRLNKVNTMRSQAWISYGYELSSSLQHVAQSWSDYSKSIGSISHKKYGSKSYYDYKLIQKYVEHNGVIFGDKAWTKVVENIGWWVVKCKDDDCTDEIIKATESTRKFFMSEKWKAYAPHYKSMVSAHYTDAWFGVSVDRKTGKYFFTAYYSVPTEGKDQVHSNVEDGANNESIVTQAKNPRIIRRKA